MRIVLVATMLLGVAVAQEPGTSAPEIGQMVWVNRAKGKGPAIKSMRGKVVLLLFWASGNLQSTMSLPKLQRLHERLSGYGLRVVTMSHETAEKLTEFVNQNDYTLPVGADSSKAAARAYGIRGWPKAFLIDAKGKVAWKGGPFKATEEALKLIGLETDPGELLHALAEATVKKDKKKIRVCCDVLAAIGPMAFDLKKWAAGLKAAPGPAPPKTDPEAALTAYVESPEQAAAILKRWATEGFDLRAWAQRRLDRFFPIDARELKELLKGHRYHAVLDALVDRRPKSSLVSTAGRHKGFRAYCARQGKGRLLLARRALMIYHWPLQGNTPRDNTGFWRELALQSWFQDKNKKMSGAQLGGRDVNGPQMPAFARRCAAQYLLMDGIARGRATLPPDLAGLAARECDRILAELKAKY